MKKFKEYLSEEVVPQALSDKGFIGVEDESVRDNINSLLNGVTARPVVTPYISLERVRKVLSYYHIFLPAHQFMQGDCGNKVFNISQFGEKYGQTNDGKFVTKSDSPYSLYFEYQMNDAGLYDIYAEVVDDDELEEILSDFEDELSDDDGEEDNSEVVSNDQQNSYLLNKDEHKGNVQEENINEIKRSTARRAEKQARYLAKNPGEEGDDENERPTYRDREDQANNIRRMRIKKLAKEVYDFRAKQDAEDNVAISKSLRKPSKKAWWKKAANKNKKKAVTGMEPSRKGNKYIGENEQLDEKTIASKKAKKGTKYKVKATEPDSEGSYIRLTQGKRKIDTGDYDHGAGAFFMRKGTYNSAKDMLKTVKEEALDEVSQKAATDAYAAADDPGYYHPKADDILKHIRRKFGKEAEKGAENHAYADHFGRNTPKPGKDSLSGGLRQYLDKKLTKKNMIPRGTQKAMKDRMNPKKWQGYGRKVGGPKGLLPEEALDEIANTKKGIMALRRAIDKAAKNYYDTYDAETDARAEVQKKRTPESRKDAENARAARIKAKDRVIKFQNYADKKAKEKTDKK